MKLAFILLFLALSLDDVFPAQMINPARTGEAPVRVSSGVMAGLLLPHQFPTFSKETMAAFRQEHGSSRLVLQAIIDEEGHIVHLTVVSGASALQQPVLDAVRQWTYKPYMLNGHPHAVETHIMVGFNFNGGN